MNSDKYIQRIGLVLATLFTITIIIIGGFDSDLIVLASIFLFIIGNILIKGSLLNIYTLIQRCRGREVGYRIKISQAFNLPLMAVILFICIITYSGPNYQTPLRHGSSPYFHEPISTLYGSWFYILTVTGVLSAVVVRLIYKKLPPLFMVILFSFIYIQIACMVAYFVQLSAHANNENPDVILAIICICNFLIYEATIMIRAVQAFPVGEYREVANSLPNRLLLNSRNWSWLALILMLPILCLCMLILSLFGQQPDHIVKAFTETSDWLLSERESPPMLPHTGHYLCTVSVQGHKSVVKPLRWGVRGGTRIWVNRQLLVANAFEQILEERIPRIHRCIRYLYDRYGYPIAKHITTPLSADIVYILMKPFEWCFLLVIYLCDRRPENRIARQYLPGLKK